MHCVATTSSLYLVCGVFSGNRGDILTRLPFTLYSFSMSWGPASAALRNVSAKIQYTCIYSHAYKYGNFTCILKNNHANVCCPLEVKSVTVMLVGNAVDACFVDKT